MDEATRQAIRARAFALWEADDRPEGRELEYWLRAEQELAPGQSVAGEEDPLAGVDELPPGTVTGGHGGG
jgi:Protein of unknown function (DUF2934)